MKLASFGAMVIVAMNNEPFVPKEVVAEYLSLPVRKVLELARRRVIRAYPIGCIRNQWRFRLSEVTDDIIALTKPAPTTISAAAPTSRRSKSNGLTRKLSTRLAQATRTGGWHDLALVLPTTERARR